MVRSVFLLASKAPLCNSRPLRKIIFVGNRHHGRTLSADCMSYFLFRTKASSGRVENGGGWRDLGRGGRGGGWCGGTERHGRLVRILLSGFHLETGPQLQHTGQSTLALQLYTCNFKLLVSLTMALSMLADLAKLYFLIL